MMASSFAFGTGHDGCGRSSRRAGRHAAPERRRVEEDCRRISDSPRLPRAIWQLVNTLGPYVFLWYLMYRSLAVSWWLVLPLAVLAGALLVRVFIIFHDCGHGSFFKSRLANDITGFITGVLTFTPYYHWRWEHSLHHATSGDLDRRGIGDSGP